MKEIKKTSNERVVVKYKILGVFLALAVFAGAMQIATISVKAESITDALLITPATGLDFGEAQEGYTAVSPQTITVKNISGEKVNFYVSSSSQMPNYTFNKVDVDLNVGESTSITVTPKAGLAVGSYNEDYLLLRCTLGITEMYYPMSFTVTGSSHTHTPSTTWSKDETNHWKECTAGDGEKMNQANHTYGEWVIDTQATETTPGSKHRDCTVCSHKETASIPATGVTPEKPVITAGAGSTHQIRNSKDMTLTCSGKLEDLTGIYVDGKLVDSSNYTLKSGSTILTLKASYLDTLSVGKHTLKFQYKDNISADTEFTITAKASETPAKPSSPKTGDTTATSLYIGLLALSGFAVAFVFRRRKVTSK